MGLNLILYNIEYDSPYSIRYKSGNHPFPVDDNTFTFYGSGYTTNELTITGATFDTQYWVKITDSETDKYLIKNINTHMINGFDCVYSGSCDN